MAKDKQPNSHATLLHRLELNFLNNENVVAPAKLSEDDVAQEHVTPNLVRDQG